jgi:hypothetical protein
MKIALLTISEDGWDSTRWHRAIELSTCDIGIQAGDIAQ